MMKVGEVRIILEMAILRKKKKKESLKEALLSDDMHAA